MSMSLLRCFTVKNIAENILQNNAFSKAENTLLKKRKNGKTRKKLARR